MAVVEAQGLAKTGETDRVGDDAMKLRKGSDGLVPPAPNEKVLT